MFILTFCANKRPFTEQFSSKMITCTDAQIKLNYFNKFDIRWEKGQLLIKIEIEIVIDVDVFIFMFLV